MANVGFKLALPGKSVNSHDPRDYIAWSKYFPLKIIKYGNNVITVPGGGAKTTLDIVHGLNYQPAYWAFYDNDNNGRFWLNSTKMGAGNSAYTGGGLGGDNTSADIVVDKYKITFTAQSPDTNAKTVPFRYILFDQPVFDLGGDHDRPVGYTPTNIGMKVSPGKNVFNAKIYQQTINSNCDYLKYHKTITGKITINNTLAGESIVEHVHGLGYVPLFIAYGYFDNDIRELPLPIGRSPNPFIGSAFADTYRILIDTAWASSPFPSTVNFYYRLVIFKNNLLS